eukprot:2734793-Alexandrium_andersonii.AAC.1
MHEGPAAEGWMVSSKDLVKSFYQDWVGHYGKPRVLRVDPEGAWMSRTTDSTLAEDDISLEPVPGEAHWQVGIVERAIGSVKDVLLKICRDFPHLSGQEALGKAIGALNAQER